MASYIRTTVRGNISKEVLTDIKEKFNGNETEDRGLWIRSRGAEIHKVLLDKSIEYDEMIEASHTLESEQYQLTHVLLYQKGLCIEKDIYINYMVNEFEVPWGYDRYEIERKIIDELRKHDSVEKTDEGFKINKNANKKIIYEHIVDGNYKFTAIKEGSYIEVRTYEISHEWRKFEYPF